MPSLSELMQRRPEEHVPDPRIAATRARLAGLGRSLTDMFPSPAQRGSVGFDEDGNLVGTTPEAEQIYRTLNWLGPDVMGAGIEAALKGIAPGTLMALSGRSTVKKPVRKEYPGVYAKPEDVISDLISAREKGIAPENPLLKEIFGVDRHDLDAMTREQSGRSSVDVPIYVPPQNGGPEYLDQIITPANTRRLQDFLDSASKTPQLAGSYGWYQAKPLYDKYVSMFGLDEGRRRFMQHHAFGAALSPGTEVPIELRRNSLATMLNESGDLGKFIDKSGILPGYGHAYHKTAQASGLLNWLDSGLPFPSDIQSAPKVRNYYYSRTNENTKWPTMDAHFIRGSGAPDVRSGTKEFGDSVRDTEAYRLRDWFTNKVAAPLDMEGSPAQALIWNTLGHQTGVKSPLSAPYLELLVNAAENQAKRTGKTPQTVLDEFMAGKGLLY